MSDKKVLFQNFSSLTLLQFANYLFPLITLPYLLRILGPENYGLMHFAAAFAAYFGILTDYGFNLSMPPKISVNRKDKNKLNEIFSSVIIIKTVLCIISFFIFSILVFSINKFSLDKEIYLLSYLSIVGQLLFPVWFFQGIEKMHVTSFITIVVRIFSVASIFIFINSSNDLTLLIFINGLTYILIGISGFIFAVKKFSIKFRWQSATVLRLYLKDGMHLFFSNISISLYTTTNIFLLGLLAGEQFVGYYAAADKIRQAVQNIFSPVTQTIYPHLSKLFKDSIKDAVRFTKKIIITAGSIILLACIVLFLFSENLIMLVAGKDYADSILILKILSFLPVIIFLSNIFGIQVLLNLGYKKIFTYIIISAAGLSLFMSFILVPIYKATGTAATFLIVELFVTVSFILIVRNKIKKLSALQIEK